MFYYFMICFKKSLEDTPALEECSPDLPGEKDKTRQNAPPEKGCGPCYHKSSLNNLEAVTERVQVTCYMGV